MTTPATATEPPSAPRRVREQAREAMTVMLFSLATSVALASALLLVSRLGSQG